MEDSQALVKITPGFYKIYMQQTCEMARRREKQEKSKSAIGFLHTDLKASEGSDLPVNT